MTNTFRREGEYWTITYGGTLCRVRDAKGLHHVAHLLRHPQQHFAAAALLASGGDVGAALSESIPPEPAGTEHARLMVTQRIKAAIKKISAHHPLLGHHLARWIKTGRHCVYLGNPHEPLDWEV